MNKNKFVKALVIALMLVISASGVNIEVKAANPNLQSVGPLNNIHGFPNWYQDATGLPLEPCLGVNPDGAGLADPNCVVLSDSTFNSALPISFPNNFPIEFFTYLADADVLTVGSVGAKVSFRFVLENSFASAAPAIGQQIAFLRVNMRVSKVNGTNGLTPDSSYIINHPFGSFTCQTDPAGDIASCVDALGNGGLGGAAYRSEDIADNPLTQASIISSVLPAPNTGIGLFLKAVSPAPPAGYIGNPNILQTIEAGPNGASLIITGPNAGGAGINSVETALWSVAGKIAVIDTIAPIIGAADPLSVPLNGAVNINFPINIQATDDLGIFTATVDIGPMGNDFTSTINGSGAGTPSPALGNGAFTIDTALNALTYNIAISGLTGGAETAAHIHGPLGSAAFNLPLGASKIGAWNYPEILESDILAGKISVHIHTHLFPNGEIAGPIVLAPDVINLIRTSGTPVDGTWSALVPGALRIGLFNLPLVFSDGSNTTNGVMSLDIVSPLAGVNISPASANIVMGQSRQLTANPIDNIGAPFLNATTVWSSNDNTIATVNPTGLVTGVKVGATVITASVTGAGATVNNTAVVNITPIPELAAINLSPAALTLVAGGDNQLISAAGVDQFGSAILTGQLSWSSSNPAVAAVDANGLVKPLAGGQATITATSGTVSGSALINVVELTSVSVSPAQASMTILGSDFKLTALPKNQNGAAFNGASVSWSSNQPAIATVDATGLVHPAATGTAIITALATDGLKSVSATSAITVLAEPQILTSLALTPGSLTLKSGTSSLAVLGFDQFGGSMAVPVGIIFTSSNPGIALVDADGLVTAVKAGAAGITVISGSLTASASIIIPAELTAINVSPSPAGMATGAIKQFTALALDQFGAALALQPAFSWSSSAQAIAQVDAAGLVTASTTPGVATITAVNGQVSGSAVLAVSAPALTSITISPATLTLTVGDSRQFSVSVLDQFNEPFAAITTLSSSNAAVGTINENALFNALAPGTTIITAINGAASSTATVTVNARSTAQASSGGSGGGGGGGGYFAPPVQFKTTASPSDSDSRVEDQIKRQLEIEKEFMNKQADQSQGSGRVLGRKIDARQSQILEIENEAYLIYSKNLSQILPALGALIQPLKEVQVKIKFLSKLKNNLSGLNTNDETAMVNFVTYGTANTKRLGEGERAGVLDSFKTAFGRLPSSEEEWQDVLKIAAGRFPGRLSSLAESRAKDDFKKIYGREARLSGENDKAAINVMAYGLRPNNRNVNAEKAALKSFRAVYKKEPSLASDWDKIRAIAYSGAKK